MRRNLTLLAAYALTLLVSATLLFLIQPMVGKFILPLFGGSPAVWTTCMVFFQAVLLAGYAYAHFTTRWLGVRRQALLHLVVLALPLTILLTGFGLARRPLLGSSANPALAVLFILTVTVGLPFFAVSTTAPLLQRWFADTGHPDARDPYFLYGASNVGSMLALLSYPTLVEPSLRLAEQAWAWTVGYTALFVLVGGCAVLLWRSTPAVETALAVEGNPPDAPTLRRRLHWLALAFVPSSLLLGATTYITTDVAAIPLLWVLPLAVYLLTFILVFSRLPNVVHQIMVLTLPVVLLLVLFLTVSEIRPQMGALVTLHLGLLFVVAMVCHGELARNRPPARYLTEFYLLMSLGGVLGGLFNALIAPLLFPALYEYPLAMVLACLLLPDLATTVLGISRQPNPARRFPLARVLDFALPVLLGLFALGLILFLSGNVWAWTTLQAVSRLPQPKALQLLLVLMYGVPAVLCYAFIDRSVRFGLGVTAYWLATLATDAMLTPRIVQGRSFFGVLIVHEEEEGEEEKRFTYHRLVHGSTVHGKQIWKPDGRLREPITYYGRQGPLGKIMEAYNLDPDFNLAVIGLGAGTTAAYAQPGQRLTFYEIDRLVERIAFDPKCFTYVTDAQERGADVRLVLGDARLEMQKRELPPEERYHILVVDAFSSDAIPVHLITREAVRLYFSRMAGGGVVAFHTSNRYLDLEPVLRNIAEAEGFVTLTGTDSTESDGHFPSTWVLMARKLDDLDPLLLHVSEGWADTKRRPEVGVWTDDFSNVWSVIRWEN